MTTRLRIKDSTRHSPSFQIIGAGKTSQGNCHDCGYRYIWLGKPIVRNALCPICWRPLQHCHPPYRLPTIWAHGVRRREAPGFHHQELQQPNPQPHVCDQASEALGTPDAGVGPR